MSNTRIARLAGLLTSAALAVMLGGCAGSGFNHSLSPRDSGHKMADGMPVTRAALPKEVEQYAAVESALQCVANTGELRGLNVAVGQWIDDTGKKTIGPGGTSDLLPSAWSILLESYSKMGATTLDITPVGRGIEDNVRSVLGQAPDVKTVLPPRARLLIAGGTWRSLDLNQTVAADMRVAGWGPTGNYSQAQLTMMTSLTVPGQRAVVAIQGLQRTVKYTSLGVGVGAVTGNTLVTGNVTVSNQERLQFEALNGPVALAAASNVVNARYPYPRDHLYMFPRAHAACGAYIASIIGGEQSTAGLQRQPVVLTKG
jgi:hypothetical protein